MNALPKVTALSEEDLNAIIADHMGVFECQENGWAHLFWGNMGKTGACSHEKCVPEGYLPRYSQSLDAMLGVETSLPANVACDYAEALEQIVWSKEDREGCLQGCFLIGEVFLMMTATALQRAQAFVVAIGRATL